MKAVSSLACAGPLGVILSLTSCSRGGDGRQELEGVPGGFTYSGRSSANDEFCELAAGHLAEGEFSQAETVYRQIGEAPDLKPAICGKAGNQGESGG